MSWRLSLLIALITGGVGLLGAGFVAARIVDWYRISSFEGGSGFFVVFMALVGGLAGTLIGLIAARVSAARPHAGFSKGLLGAVGSAAVVLLIVGGVARLFADIPPEIDGETLLLHVELRSPAGDTMDIAALPGLPYVRLGALAPFSNVQRASEHGPLWLEDVRREDGRWIVPGAVAIFTNRGRKVLDIGIGDTALGGFLIPLAGSPSRDDLEWTPWYPQARDGEPPLPDQFTCRYRVVRRSDPVRTTTIGPFAIDSMISGFYSIGGSERLAANGEFRVRYQGQPIPGLERAVAVAAIGSTPALFVRTEDETLSQRCYLVAVRDRDLVKEAAPDCGDPSDAMPVTNDVSAFAAARKRVDVPGWVDRETLALPGIYLIQGTLLDTRTLTMRAVTLVGPSGESCNPNVPPLGLSPDERYIAWWAVTSDDRPQVGVTDTTGGVHAILPVDRARMRYANFDHLDPAWLLHHFGWSRDASGRYQLEERQGFKPLAHRGEYSNENDYSNFRVEPAGEPLRAAIERWLVEDLKAEAFPNNQPGAFSHSFRVDGEEINVMTSDGSDSVSLAMPTGIADKTAIIRRLGEKLNAKLATGVWDELFQSSKFKVQSSK